MRFLTRRLAFYLLTAWAALTLNFLIPRLMPGDPVLILLARMKGKVSPEAVTALKLQFGIGTHATLLQQYGSYLAALAHGDLGLSISYYPTPVATVIGQSLPWTLALVGVSTVVSFVLGTFLGIVIAWRRGSWMDSLLPITTFFTAVPYFWLALLLVLLLGVLVRAFPISGGYSVDTTVGLNLDFIASALYHAVLPALTIVLSSIAGWLLGMRNLMVSTMADDYVLWARAKGLSERRVMLVYAARNAILPSVASLALSIGFVVSGALLTEMVFSYPGVGYVLFQAVANEDFPLAQAIFLIITLTVLVANLLADVSYSLLDPRIRAGTS